MESLKIRFAGACRSTLLCILALSLCGCGSPRFAGESVSDPVLRRDALRHVEVLHQCRQLRQVSPEILGFQLDSPGSLAFARERWQVSGCGRRSSYLLDFHKAADGGVDFRVSAE